MLRSALLLFRRVLLSELTPEVFVSESRFSSSKVVTLTSSSSSELVLQPMDVFWLIVFKILLVGSRDLCISGRL